MNVDAYGLMAGGLLMTMGLTSYFLLSGALARSEAARAEAARAAGRSKPNDDMIKNAVLFFDLAVMPLVGYFLLGPVLADIFGAH